MKKSFKFSVVSPAYNVEPYIAEAIESVIAQDIGFQNIQLILVDDGSSDGTGAVIDRYAKKYPDNIIALHQKNAGVSAARNAGIALATGKYLNCLDADDLWECHVFSRVFAFFEEHYDETDIVSCPIYHFTDKPNRKKPHYLNHKFKKGSRVILLDEEPGAIQYHCNSVFIKRTAVTLPFFEPGLAFSEDILALQQLLMERQTLGVVASCPYWYRTRAGIGEPSALQRKESDKQWYCDRLERVFIRLLHEGVAKFQSVPRFIQYAVCNDLFWVLQMKQIPSEAGLSPEDIDRFFRLIRELLRQIEDDIILSLSPHPGLTIELRLRALQLKYGREPVLTPLGNDFMVGFQPEAGLLKRISTFSCILDFLTVRDNVCTLEGRFMCPAGIQHNGLGFSVKANGICHEAKMSVYQDSRVHMSLGTPTLYQHIFKVEIPLDPKRETTDLKILLQFNGVSIPLRRQLFLGKFFPLTDRFSKAFCILGGVKCTLLPDGIRLSRRYSAFLDELRFMKELWQKNQTGFRKAVLIRALYRIRKFFKRKPLWLCSDRPEKADDNGEVFFEYLRKNHPEIDSRFVLNRNSPDWERLKKIGPVVEIGSREHKMLRLLSDCRAVTETGDYGGDELRLYKCYQDILNKSKTVFLQHGITHNDVSWWTRKNCANLAGFVTAAQLEQQSILEGNYGYNEKEIWLTGFPRHDRLYNDSKKKITVMPTWRRYLLGEVDKGQDLRRINPSFYSSSYRKFYHDLLNHERLLKCAEERGYQLCFFPHPQLQKYVSEFRASPSVQVYGYDRTISYREIFAESDLVITDYSSIVFDFALLRKPVIYAQFDKEDFFGGNHMCVKGYFDYERDGFGEVEHDLESTVDRIIEYIKNGCQLKDQYRKRIDSFFAFHDHHCCDRVFTKITEIAG